jgi:ferredoxin-NADP reductase
MATRGRSSAIAAIDPEAETRPPARLTWKVAEVVAVRQETPRVKTLALAVPGWMAHKAGQHVDIRLTAEDGYQAQRSYSISSPPENPQVELTVETIEEGEVSPYLTGEVRPGDKFELRGPIGGFFVWTAGIMGPLVLIGGGSGVAPLMAILRHRAKAGASGQATLIYSSRTFDDIIYREELERLAEADPSLRIVHTLTRGQPPGWSGYGRRIDPAMLQELGVPHLPGSNVFICGPSGMVESASQALIALGIEAANIKTERFGPSGG